MEHISVSLCLSVCVSLSLSVCLSLSLSLTFNISHPSRSTLIILFINSTLHAGFCDAHQFCKPNSRFDRFLGGHTHTHTNIYPVRIGYQACFLLCVLETKQKKHRKAVACFAVDNGVFIFALFIQANTFLSLQAYVMICASVLHCTVNIKSPFHTPLTPNQSIPNEGPPL